MRDSLKDSKPVFDMSQLIEAARTQADGNSERPVEMWNPPLCGEMDMVIKPDGSWWHEGGLITRRPLVKLFASILRKDEDGVTYLVTPGENIAITVERAPFIAGELRVSENDKGERRFFFTTNLDDVIELSAQRPLMVSTDPETLEPTPLLRVRGRLDALITRAVFYELIDYAVERRTAEGMQLGLETGGAFYPLGPPGIHET
jgi:hypothetical protein